MNDKPETGRLARIMMEFDLATGHSETMEELLAALRDELADKWRWFGSEVTHLRNERDQARDQIKGWENKWQCAVEMAAKAELERDDAREALDEETKFHHRTHAELVQTQCQLQDAIRERDEAREALRTPAEHGENEIQKLIKERDEARHELENYKAVSIHSCHDQCERPMCVLRRERDDAREMVKAILKNQFGTNCEFIDHEQH